MILTASVLGLVLLAPSNTDLFGMRVQPGNARMVGDFDGDGDIDRVAFDKYATPPTYTPYWGDGSGAFVAGVPSIAPFGLWNERVVDVDGDGIDEIVVPDALNDFAVLRVGAAGIAQTPFVPAPGDFLAFACGDFDGDGDVDVLSRNASSFQVFASDGAGNFAPSRSFPYAAGASDSAAAGDFDGDGDLDAAFTATGVGLQSGFTVVENLGGGSLAPSVVPSVLGGPFEDVSAVGDFDGDGRADLVTRQTFAQSPQIVRRRGTAVATTFLVDAPFFADTFAPGCPEANEFLVGDVDFDGKDDLVYCAVRTTFWSTIDRRLAVVRDAATPTGLALIHQQRVPGSGGESSYNRGALVDVDRDGTLDWLHDVGTQCSHVLRDVAQPIDDIVFVDVGIPAVRAAAPADFDLDGDVDIAFISDTVPVGLVRNLGGGAFAPAVGIPAWAQYAQELVATDFDGDGDADLVVHGSSSIAILRGDGLGGFTLLPQQVTHQPGGTNIPLQAVDANHDGFADVIFKANGLTAFAYGSAAGLTAVGGAPGSGPFAWGDVSGDGYGDLVYVMFDGAFGTILTVADGAPPLWLLPVMSVPLSAQPHAIACGDIDQDGRAEVVVAYGDARRVEIYRSTGVALFLVQSFDVALDGAAELSMQDVTGDGWVDVAVTSPLGSVMTLFTGRYDGALVPAGAYWTHGGGPFADFDADGLLDRCGTIGGPAIAIQRRRSGSFGVVGYGQGKAGPKGMPTLSALGEPILGQKFGIRIGGGEAWHAPVLLIGTQRVALPFAGGTLNTLPLLVVPLWPFSAGHVDLPIALPATPALAGVAVDLQAMFEFYTATFDVDIAQTPGLELVFGS